MNARFGQATVKAMGLAILAAMGLCVRGPAGEGIIAVEVNTPPHQAQAPSNGLTKHLESLAQSNTQSATATKKEDPAPVLRRKALDYGGALPQVSANHQPQDLLRLFNPFAPVELGRAQRGGAPWHTFSGPWATPRSFRDAQTYEPQGIVLISIGF